ncbi:hypothetical protein L2223_27125, partial [Xanthomonas perforans]|uniref:hypothetical protein n=1 Tax=Xanthomonas perforans TaxID=442694 RepID=UPI001F4350B4
MQALPQVRQARAAAAAGLQLPAVTHMDMQRIILHGNAYLQIADAAAEPQTVLDRVFHQQLHAESWYPSQQCGCIHVFGIAQALAQL